MRVHVAVCQKRCSLRKMLPYVVTLFSISYQVIIRLGAKFKRLNIIMWILDTV